MSKNEIAILGLLSESPMHGYQIHQEITRREMDYWAKIKLASIYSTLARLEEAGLIKSEKEKVGNTPERTVYSITEEGRQQLSEMVEYFLREDERPEWPFGLGVAFIQGASRERVLAALQHRREKLLQCDRDLQAHLVELKDRIPFNWFMLIENAHKHMKLELEWLEQLALQVQAEERWTLDWPAEAQVKQQKLRTCAASRAE
ncbi:MAG: PadR family transcriptional regulator [candidate division KSB1 bacterium]|nr:PadR family transcriptional regulator [candidate division KSB1 bacterium]MDZ7274374.1 PadR family transcriptional regulator [candidate division KSB1 bacterium]MDZ7284964.1 PadR family transcriptional regulator [candidate division KSB1 bacterium]MDZ7297615.1 PadR family transcriptional regulator [candidate division KSB1 bacterium]MDZ7306355.1 PadR family transcriptional regulator [candidate division KSB1 bacterium]